MTPAVLHASICRDCPARAGCRTMHSGRWCDRWPAPPADWQPGAPPALIEPRIADLEHGELPPAAVSRAQFTARLAACRACPLWDEAARHGRGSCASVRCSCSRRALWHPSDRCPESRWLAMPALPAIDVDSPTSPAGRGLASATCSPVAALYVRRDSIYKEMGVDCWDFERDARNWPGGMPCIAHPPCRAWGVLSHMASPRPGEHHCARIAVWQIRENGGVLEHPKGSKLWKDQSLPEPGERDRWGGWTMIVPQRWWGHPMMKETRLYIVGCEPKDIPPVPYTMEPATHAMGGKWLPDIKKRLGRDGVIREDARAAKVREGTPPAFAAWLVELARKCHRVNKPAHQPSPGEV